MSPTDCVPPPLEENFWSLTRGAQRTARPVHKLVQCLQRATCVAQKPVARPFDLSMLHEHKVADQSREVNANFTSVDDVQMQAWKYVLDWHSEAELLGVLDDDACLLDHVLRGDLMTCSDKIIVRGVRFERRPIKTKHEISNGFLGISSDVNFMVPLLCSKRPSIWGLLGCSRLVACISRRSCPSLSRNQGRGAEIARRGGSGSHDDVLSRRWRPRGRIAGARRHRRNATHKSRPKT